MALQALVWTFLGAQYGPVPSEASWKQQARDIPYDPERRGLRRFRKGAPPTHAQLRWYYQAFRAGTISCVHASFQRFYEKELQLPHGQSGLAMGASMRRLRSVSDIREKSFLQYARRALTSTKTKAKPTASGDNPPKRAGKPEKQARTTAPASSTTKPPSSGSLADARARMHSRNAPLQPASPQRPQQPSDKPRGRTPTASKTGGPMAGQSQPAGSKRAASASSGARQELAAKKPRAPAAPSARGVSTDRGADFLAMVTKDQALKADRQQFMGKAGSDLKAPIDPQFCLACAVSPPHARAEDCIVVQFLMQLIEARKGVIPCDICGAKKHTTNACLFIHTRCTRCLLMGHLPHECAKRTPREWMVHYMQHAHKGRLTRNNPDGPFRGRYGFGNVEHIEMTRPVQQLVDSTTATLARLRATTPDDPDPTAELHAAWMALIQAQDDHQRQLQQESLHLGNELVRRVAAALQLPAPAPSPATAAPKPSTSAAATPASVQPMDVQSPEAPIVEAVAATPAPSVDASVPAVDGANDGTGDPGNAGERDDNAYAIDDTFMAEPHPYEVMGDSAPYGIKVEPHDDDDADDGDDGTSGTGGSASDAATAGHGATSTEGNESGPVPNAETTNVDNESESAREGDEEDSAASENELLNGNGSEVVPCDSDEGEMLLAQGGDGMDVDN